MKNFAVLTTLALFGLALFGGPVLGADDAHPVVIQDTTSLSYYQLTVIGILTVIAILLALALSQLSGAKTALEKLASK